MQNNTGKTRKLTGIAIFTAIVIVLQLLGSFIRSLSPPGTRRPSWA